MTMINLIRLNERLYNCSFVAQTTRIDMANLNYVVGRVRNLKRKANGKENVQARR